MPYQKLIRRTGQTYGVVLPTGSNSGSNSAGAEKRPAGVACVEAAQQSGPSSLAMRLIDDFLFVTPSATAARALIARLQAGRPCTQAVYPSLLADPSSPLL